MLQAKPYQQQYLDKACSGRWHNMFNQKGWFALLDVTKNSSVLFKIYEVFKCEMQ